MKLEEYEKRLTALQHDRSLSCGEFEKKMAELQAEYLAEQAVPDAEKAIGAITATWYGGELTELGEAPLPQWECQFLELNDNGRPDEGTWRCTGDNFVIDVSAEDGEVNLISV